MQKFQIIHRLRSLYKKLQIHKLKYTLPFLILAVYTVFGAYIFRHFELQSDEERRAQYRKDAEYAFNDVMSRLMEARCDLNLSAQEKTLQARHTKDILFWFIDYLNLTQVIEERTGPSPWTWMTALFYAGQLYTTIGYGIPVAQTSEGRLASIFYIMIGIPIFLIIMAEVGKLLSRALRKLYKKIRTAQRASKLARRRMSEPVKAIYSLTMGMAGVANGGSFSFSNTSPPHLPVKKQNSDAETGSKSGTSPSSNKSSLNKLKELSKSKQAGKSPEKVDKESENDGRKSFPVPLALLMLIVWILFSAAMFRTWETEWTFFTSVYFFFVSISTVGLGDIVPTKPDMMFVNFFMILIGLALLSMCVNLIQEALEKLMERLIEQYIDEIEKIAAIVSNESEFSEFSEFAEELTPFQVGSADMLTVPLASEGVEEQRPISSSIAQTIKDWVAEQASNALLNRIYPPSSDSESSDSENENEGDSGELEGVVVYDKHGQVLRGESAIVTIHKPILAEGAQLVPKISIHEGTPPDPAALSQHQLEEGDKKKKETKGAKQKKKEHHQRYALRGRAALLQNMNPRTIQAMQALGKSNSNIATAHGGAKPDDFRSRLFAKLASNQRMVKIADEKVRNSPDRSLQQKKPVMVSSSIQTTPPMSPRTNSWRLAAGQRFKPGLHCCKMESMDSASSAEINCVGAEWASFYDVDSLCSGYYDSNFGHFSTDSVVHLMGEPNTPVNLPSTPDVTTTPMTKNPLDRVDAKLSETEYFNRMFAEGEANVQQEMPQPFPISSQEQRPGHQRPVRFLRHAYSTPSTPPIANEDSPISSTKNGTGTTTAPQSPPNKTKKSHPSHTLPIAGSALTRFANHFNRPPRPSDIKMLVRNRTALSVPTDTTNTPNTTPTAGYTERIGTLSPVDRRMNLSPLASIPLYHPSLLSRRRYSENGCAVVTHYNNEDPTNYLSNSRNAKKPQNLEESTSRDVEQVLDQILVRIEQLEGE